MVTWTDFGTRLFDMEEADPGYMMLARVDWPESKKMRFMTAWCTYYNPGIAARAASLTGKPFWDYLFSVYDTAQRASERRHFRGDAGLKAIRSWEVKFRQPEKLVEYMRGPTYFDVRKRAKDVAQIGTYFVWKFADVQEAVFQVPCDFTGAEKYSPKVPQEGARLISIAQPIEKIYAMIANTLNMRLPDGAPPFKTRPFNMQEAETVCCVYHQFVSGGYWWHSRRAKATRRLLADGSDDAVELLTALHKGHPTQHLTLKETARWADEILMNG